MTWRHYALLLLIGLIVPSLVARYQSLPGYMDADYYFAGGIQLAIGNGFNEPYLWNYLDDPAGLPHPSHTYWMPLASIVSALGMWISGQTSYAAGRFPFILLSGLVPVLTAALGWKVTGRVLSALVAGLLSVFSLYYAPFMPVPDNYALYMLLGAAFLLIMPRREKWIPLALGALAGLMTLARSDGLLWLGIVGLSIMWTSGERAVRESATFKGWFARVAPAGVLALAGYLLVMGPWHLRNLNLFDAVMTPGGGRLLWLQSYNETFIYPPAELDRASFLDGGWDLALQNRVRALTANLANAFAAQGGIFLFPLIILGLWRLRGDIRTRIAVTGWVILFLVMTLVFPFAGSRGSFFHAGAAFQPYWWVAAPIGLEALIEWARARGRFTDQHAPYIFQGLLVVLAVLLTAYLVNFRVVVDGWARDDLIYPSVEGMFLENGINPGDVVIVRNPPGYYIASGRPSVSLPFGDEATILAVAERYGARYLVIEKGGTFEAIQDLYEDPRGNPAFIYLGEINEARLYRIDPAP